MSSDGNMTRENVLDWIDRHDAAWRASDAAAIGELFSEDAVYHTGPWDEPWRGISGPFRGRHGIAAGWLAGNIAGERFETWTDILAIEGRRAVVRRRITYLDGARSVDTRWDTIWVIDFDAKRRCVEYREWYVKAPAEAG